MDIANRYSLVVVEDAAQALLSERNGKRAGSFGAMAAFSFHEAKNIISGEGRALSITDPAYITRAEIIREKGTNRKQFFLGAFDTYTWVDLVSSFLPSELTASFLYAQLEIAKKLTRDHLFDGRAERLTNWIAMQTPHCLTCSGGFDQNE